MRVPPIEHQVKREVGASAEATAWGSVEWAVREGDPPGAEQTFALAVWAPGQGNAEHTHPNCEEIVYVIDGVIDHTLGEQAARLGAGDLIVVPRGVPHRLVNTSAAVVRTVIVFSSPDRHFVPTV
jgi:quercetin dioxygenase-like cupin family protein